MSDPDIVIVGAGAAGLSAARTLRDAGRSVVVLEAHESIGGRARTSSPDGLRGAWFDEGASWLHQVDRNALVDLARDGGETLRPAHQGGRRLYDGGRDATAAETGPYDAAAEAWHAAATRLAASARTGGPDPALSAAGDRWSPDDPWLANIEFWEGAIIAAADADALSMLDWQRNQLDEGDLIPRDGVGRLLRRCLGAAAGAVRCGVAVRRIDWSAPGHVTIDTDTGTLRAGACIVTVSTGVLRDERIAFAPALPGPILAALDGLPMGLLSKAAFRIDDRARFDVQDGTLLERRLGSRGGDGVLLAIRPDESPLATGFLGGRHAWSLAGREHEALDSIRDGLADLLGRDALKGLVGDGAASRWGSDPLFLGSYAYARPGHAGARAALGTPFADGRLVLAGEASCQDGLAGTVGGAIQEGARAAHAIMAALPKY
jgi:monoamine oxidase